MSGNETKLYKRTTGKWRNTETDFHPPPAGYQDWQVELCRYLAAAGTEGRQQQHILSRFQNWATAAVIVHELECLQIQDKVQKFKVPRKTTGPIPTVWRATNKILED